MKLIDNLFLGILGFALIGYAYGNKGFAYIGITPFYIDSLTFTTAALVHYFASALVSVNQRPCSYSPFIIHDLGSSADHPLY